MDIEEEINRLRGRFRSLAEDDQAEVPGAYELAAGLEKVVTHLRVGESVNDDRLAVIIQGLAGLADYLEPGPVDDKDIETTSQDDTDAKDSLAQFVATFRKDAGNRLQGLSISLMGIFGDVGSDEALDQSAGHLHAIRGGAAMLGFDDIAKLSAAMENTLKAKKKIDPRQRDWPTKTLLRGYALLDAAIASEPPAIASDDADSVIEILRRVTAGTTGQSTPAAGTRKPQRELVETPVQIEGHGAETTVETSSDDEEKSHVSSAESGESSESPDTLEMEQPVLIVDDVETIAASIGFILSELEVPIEVASNGEEAMQMLERKAFSLVISDVDMPRMDGIALTRMIRSTDDIDQLPVILLTSLDHPEERQAGMEAGATDYIIKGAIGGGELLGRVKELLEVAPVVERQEKYRERRILVAEDTETVAASIAFVLSEGPFEIILAPDGKDALRRLKKESFDLLITDLQMPYMNGTELVGEVRADDDLGDIPIVMLTSVEDDDEIAQAVDAGVDRYLIKGEIAGGKLLDIVDELLDD